MITRRVLFRPLAAVKRQTRLPVHVQRVFFCENSNSTSSSSSFPIQEYHALADKELEIMVDALGVIEDNLDEADISFSQGILNIDLGDKGCWVINKQAPNKQLWWSSPISGPKRYDYEEGKWYVKRQDSNVSEGLDDIMKTLQKEMQSVTGITIDIDNKDE